MTSATEYWAKRCAASDAENERLRAICKTIATGLRGEYASRLDMAKLAESAVQQLRQEPTMAKDPLMNLADALVEDIMQMSDEEILAESSPEEIEEAKQARDRALALADRPFFECPHCGGDIAVGGCVCRT